MAIGCFLVASWGNEATDTQLPYDPRVTGHRSQLKPVLNVALSSPLGAIECFIGWFSPQPGLLGPEILWVPSHVGVAGNEEADVRAAKGAKQALHDVQKAKLVASWGGGGLRGQNPKIHRRIIQSPKMMISQLADPI